MFPYREDNRRSYAGTTTTVSGNITAERTEHGLSARHKDSPTTPRKTEKETLSGDKNYHGGRI